MKKLINSDQLKNVFGDDFKIYKSTLIQKMYESGQIKKIEDIIDHVPQQAFVVLYESKLNQGHWCALIKSKDNDGYDTVEFFDSYSGIPDSVNNSIPQSFRNNNTILKLLRNSDYNISYNHNKFQKLQRDINTCGRHVMLRILFAGLPLDYYIMLFNSFPYDPDKSAVILSDILL